MCDFGCRWGDGGGGDDVIVQRLRSVYVCASINNAVIHVFIAIDMQLAGPSCYVLPTPNRLLIVD